MTQGNAMHTDENFAATDDELHVLIHSLSSTLINIDLEHQSELKRLHASRLTDEFRVVISRTLQERHRQRREPYVRHLSELRRRAVNSERQTR